MQRLLPILVCLTASAAALAQFDRGGQRGRGFDRGAPSAETAAERMQAGLTARLSLDADQQTLLSDLISERMADPAVQQHIADMQAAFAVMAEARETGDEAAIQAARAEMRSLRETRPNFAQEIIDGLEPHLNSDQAAQLAEWRERRAQRRMNDGPGRRGRGGPRIPPEELIATLPDQLGLSDTQRAEFDSLVDGYSEQFAAAADHRTQRRELMRGIASARRDGDHETADALRNELENLGRPEGRPLLDFRNDLAEILTPEQREQLEQLLPERGARRDQFARRGGGREATYRDMLAVLREMDLTSEQRDQIRDAANVAQQTARDQQQAALEQFKSEVMTVLTPEQQQVFSEEIARRAERAGADRRGPGGTRRGFNGDRGSRLGNR